MSNTTSAAADPIVARVIAELQDRSARGQAKYGTTLARDDLTARDWLQHLKEELLDAALYCEALMAERDRLRKLVTYLAGENTDHVQVHLSGNPIVCDAVIAEARAALNGGEDDR